MAEILGLGVTHYPGLMAPEAEMHAVLTRALASSKVPAAMKDPARWPAPMRREWEAQQDAGAAREHRRRLVEGFRAVRAALDQFKPDFVLVWGDDQYENFREDGVPAFCVFALDQITSRPFARKGFYRAENVWGEGRDTEFHTQGHAAGASFVAANLLKRGFDVAYAYTMRYELGLPHAFINTLLYLDFDRTGFPYPVVPFHVNCYGSSVIAKRGAAAHFDGADAGAFDPPSPSPARCFALGAEVARMLIESPWRVALISSSSWSHAFLTEKNHWLWPDTVSDRARFEELRDGRFARWRELTTPDVEAAGQHEFLNWVCLAGAMDALGRRAEIVDYVESFIFNSDKCFAVFRPAA
jgi:hypothetical protein